MTAADSMLRRRAYSAHTRPVAAGEQGEIRLITPAPSSPPSIISR